MKKQHAKIGVAGLVILAVVLLGYLWLRPQPCEQEYSSVIYSNDTGMVKNTVMGLKGDTYRGFPGKSEFVGKLTADGDLQYEIKLKESGGYYLGIMTFFGEDRRIHTIGIVNASIKLNKLWVMLTDINERYGFENGEGYIAGPASTLEEGQQVAREIMGSP
ncbi:hypothetical protein [Paenibacillus tianjinensis]|uniref:DUF4825 domain-containing protein n=1 Tax=Paenibacillus tianjinensis TaxID=2810347 RepID=A0ABX7LEU7_9BACL|nr:hypothetical protein [Paenibacillus tianjinensis]QSF45941.1 hypothetical protein JRJ22_04725 [Paenibacillus tianjinensis]